MFIVNKILAADKIGSIESNNKSIKKYWKLSKIRKLSKSWKSAKLEKNCQKIRIHLILILKKMSQAFQSSKLGQPLIAYN